MTHVANCDLQSQSLNDNVTEGRSIMMSYELRSQLQVMIRLMPSLIKATCAVNKLPKDKKLWNLTQSLYELNDLELVQDYTCCVLLFVLSRLTTTCFVHYFSSVTFWKTVLPYCNSCCSASSSILHKWQQTQGETHRPVLGKKTLSRLHNSPLSIIHIVADNKCSTPAPNWLGPLAWLWSSPL